MACPYCDYPANGGNGASAWLSCCPKCFNAYGCRANGHTEFVRLTGAVDVRELAPPGSAIAHLFHHVPQVIERLPVLQGLPQRVLAAIHDPIASMDDIAQLVAQDPGMSVRILNIANSALYGGGQRIDSLPLACTRLGMRTVANLVLAMGARSCFAASDPRFKPKLTEQWEHSVVTAHVAERLGRLVDRTERDSLFSAGLLHDIGKVVLIQLIADRSHGAPDGLRNSDANVDAALGKFHALLGLHVAVRNNLHDSLREAMFYHHAPERVESDAQRGFVYALALANGLAHEAGYGASSAGSRAAADAAAEYFGIGPARRSELAGSVQHEAASVVEALSAA